MSHAGAAEMLLDKVIDFADADDNIRAVVVTGSHARGDTDALSDLDVELYVREPRMLLDDDSWHGWFGHVVAVEALPNPDWHPTRLLYLSGAKKVDFMIAPVTALRDACYDRPFTIVIDKDDVTTHLHLSSTPLPAPPTPAEFAECVNWFAAAAIMCAKSIARADLWMAKLRDWDGKSELLRMVEWDHKSRHGWDQDTWYLGKNITRWMDPEIQSRVAECWGHFDSTDSARALYASMRLFRDLASAVAPKVSAPDFDYQAVEDEVAGILSRPDE